MIDAPGIGGKTRYRSQEALSRERPHGRDGAKSGQRGGTGGERCGYLRVAEVSRQRPSAFVERGACVQLGLRKHSCSFRSEVSKLDARASPQLTLEACSPRVNPRHGLVKDVT